MIYLVPVCLGGVILLYLLCTAIAARAAFLRYFNRRYEGNKNLRYFTAEDFEGLDADPVSFPSGEGITLRGYLYRAKEQPSGLIIFSHGFGAGHEAYTTEINYFAQCGFWVLAYDGAGCVHSDGSFEGFDRGPLDIKAALRFAAEDERLKAFSRIVLVGHSWGAFSVMNAIDMDERVAGIVAMCGFITSAGVMGQTGGGKSRLLIFAFTMWLRLFNRIRFGKTANMDSLKAMLKTKKQALLLYGQKDKTVPYRYNGRRMAEGVKGKENIECIVYPDKAHNVYLTGEAEKYMHGEFAAITEKAKKKGENAEALYASVDYARLTEEDAVVMQKIVQFCFSLVENESGNAKKG